MMKILQGDYTHTGCPSQEPMTGIKTIDTWSQTVYTGDSLDLSVFPDLKRFFHLQGTFLNVTAIRGMSALHNVTSLDELFDGSMPLTSRFKSLQAVEGIEGMSWLENCTLGYAGLPVANADLGYWPALRLASEMYRGCHSLTAIRNYNKPTLLTDTNYMFRNCEGLTGSVSGYVDVLSANNPGLTSSTSHRGMFSGCTSLSDYKTITAEGRTNKYYYWVK